MHIHVHVIRDVFANSLQTQVRTNFTVSETWLKIDVPTLHVLQQLRWMVTMFFVEIIQHQKVGVLWHTFPFILKSLGDLILKADARILSYMVGIEV